MKSEHLNLQRYDRSSAKDRDDLLLMCNCGIISLTTRLLLPMRSTWAEMLSMTSQQTISTIEWHRHRLYDLLLNSAIWLLRPIRVTRYCSFSKAFCSSHSFNTHGFVGLAYLLVNLIRYRSIRFFVSTFHKKKLLSCSPEVHTRTPWSFLVEKWGLLFNRLEWMRLERGRGSWDCSNLIVYLVICRANSLDLYRSWAVKTSNGACQSPNEPAGHYGAIRGKRWLALNVFEIT